MIRAFIEGSALAFLFALGACAPVSTPPGAPTPGDAEPVPEAAAPPAAPETAAPAATKAAPADPVPAPPSPALAAALEAIEALRPEIAPDRRTARFDIEARDSGGVVVLTGETTSPEGASRLRAALDGRGVPVVDRVIVLPEAELADRPFALVNNSVANLRSAPEHPAELATQALLGTPVRLLKRRGGFYLAQVPDGYIAWVDAGGIHRVTAEELDAWRSAPRAIYLRPAGVALAEPRADAGPVADLVAGSIVALEGAEGDYLHVRFPDGRRAFVPRSEARPFDDWAREVRATEESLVATARQLLGAPYLWGGTSAKGMDCSGFTKTVYLLNGIVLPRDASQQVHSGTLVDEAGDFSRLRPGDLLFFGRRASNGSPERVVHVGMWIGGGRYIHSSGRVRIASVDPAAPDYDAYNRDRYLRARRILGSPPGAPLVRDGALFPF